MVPVGPPPSRNGVVVVGAGVVGASVTYHLARLGAGVTLLDREPAAAAGVTGASFAWIGGAGGDWPGGAEDLRGSVLADHRRLEAEVPDYAVRWTGSLSWTGERAGSPAVPGGHRVARDDIAALEPHLRTPPAHAVHIPGDGGLDPAAMTRALIAAARARGAAVVLGAAVRSLEFSAGRVVGVRTPAGVHPAATVVLAAGTGVAELSAPLPADVPVSVSPAFRVRVAAPPGLVRTIVSTPEFEVREVRDGELLMTLPRVAGTSPQALARAAEVALRHLKDAFHGAGTCRVLDYGLGHRPVPPRGPLIGYATPDRSAYVAVMHSAVTLAPTAGRLVADELTTGEPPPELRRCRPSPNAAASTPRRSPPP
ncbi:FAD-binding oxidoreductase [Streptomyces sp. WMMC500]|uniref:NAD(P)/FAD-dependent oxidoreductase n=1 Tax=Streptomyces sp. WMMC500 TaxID=3015154 RepID=UPI00248B9E47|nr:FAD-binding oxidoreductase [Streptomyces sp. WMMC500]WBB61689.1 FAD-binding oxidoreductase [Streptomyces sp. WMMC500]